MDSGIICIVTIHGIGFQQPPLDGVAGYADDLHTHLSGFLQQNDTVLLSDDPDRQAHQKGDSVPIYVQSVWPPQSLCREDGLKRLGSWDERRQTINHDDAPLVTGNARIAHVALVYSGLEGEGPEVEAAVIAGSMVTVSAKHYSHVTGVLDMVFLDIMQPLMQSFWSNLLKRPPQHGSVQVLPKPSLGIRQDEGYTRKQGFPQHPDGFMAILRQLENDVAVYVCHNEKRQRIRSFVLDALLRLALRDDVAGIVLNTHSNGTVVGLDVIQELPPLAARKIRAFITAGSPIRKYVDLFDWGKHIATVPKMERWWNFWDAKDIVADPLLPSTDYVRGDQATPEQLIGIYQALDSNTGEVSPMPIKDILVDNMANSPAGGLQAHNYWDNTKEFIPQVGKLLREIVEEDKVPLR